MMHRRNELITSNTKWWCSGFYPGTLWLIYEGTKDNLIKAEAEKRLSLMEPEKNFAPTTMWALKCFAVLEQPTGLQKTLPIKR